MDSKEIQKAIEALDTIELIIHAASGSEVSEALVAIRAALSANDTKAIRRYREAIEQASIDLECYASVHEADAKDIDGIIKNLDAAILGTEPAQEAPKLPLGFNPYDPCDSCAREVGDPACLNCENIEGQVDSEWIPKGAEPAQDKCRGNECEDFGCEDCDARKKPAQNDEKAEVKERALYLIGEMMSYDNYHAYPPNLTERVDEFMRAAEVERRIEEAKE